MSNAAATLDNFFGYRQSYVTGDQELKELESTRSLTRVKAQVDEAAKKSPLSISANELHRPIGELLNISLLDIIVRAWNANNLFEKYLDPEKYDPNESVLISLVDHSITSNHSPYIEVGLNGKKLGQIDFQINLALSLEGVILEIIGGQLREIRLGTMRGSGTLKCEDLVLLKRNTGSVEFPGKIPYAHTGNLAR